HRRVWIGFLARHKSPSNPFYGLYRYLHQISSQAPLWLIVPIQSYWLRRHKSLAGARSSHRHNYGKFGQSRALFLLRYQVAVMIHATYLKTINRSHAKYDGRRLHANGNNAGGHVRVLRQSYQDSFYANIERW